MTNKIIAHPRINVKRLLDLLGLRWRLLDTLGSGDFNLLSLFSALFVATIPPSGPAYQTLRRWAEGSRGKYTVHAATSFQRVREQLAASAAWRSPRRRGTCRQTRRGLCVHPHIPAVLRQQILPRAGHSPAHVKPYPRPSPQNSPPSFPQKYLVTTKVHTEPTPSSPPNIKIPPQSGQTQNICAIIDSRKTGRAT